MWGLGVGHKTELQENVKDFPLIPFVLTMFQEKEKNEGWDGVGLVPQNTCTGCRKFRITSCFWQHPNGHCNCFFMMGIAAPFPETLCCIFFFVFQIQSHIFPKVRKPV